MIKMIWGLIAIFLASPILQAEPQPEFDLSTKCGTFRYLDKIRDPNTKEIRILSENYIETSDSCSSPSGKFLIHYDRAGIHKVDPQDKNQNRIPDYIDSVGYYFDFVYNVQVNELGFKSPYPDNGRGGTNQYDVYIQDIGNGDFTYYGVTHLGDPILPFDKFGRYYSYIVIDNDYSPYDMKLDNGKLNKSYYTTGIMGLKVTASHEFQHAVQFLYGIPYGSESLSEMASVYMENRVFPESIDYLQYVRAMFNNLNKFPFGNGFSDIGYSYGIYFEYITTTFGEDIIRRQYEQIELGLPPFQALDAALQERGSSIISSWDEFLAWIYYSGSRAIEGKYFKDAKSFPDLTFNYTGHITSDEHFDISGQLLPFEIRPLRYVIEKENLFETPDTLDFIISNTDLNATFMQAMELSDVKLVYPDLTKSYKSLCDRYYSIVSDRSFLDTSFCRPGYLTIEGRKPYPSPFKLSYDKDLHFPAPANVLYASKVQLQIFNIDNVELWSDTKRVVVNNMKRVAVVQPEELKLGSGVYLYRISYGEQSEFGKFIVVQ